MASYKISSDVTYTTEGSKHTFVTLHFIRVIHYNDVIMSAMASQITFVSIVCSTVSSCAYQRKHQSSPSLAFVRGIRLWPWASLHKGSVTRKMFLFDDVIMLKLYLDISWGGWLGHIFVSWLDWLNESGTGVSFTNRDYICRSRIAIPSLIWTRVSLHN